MKERIIQLVTPTSGSWAGFILGLGSKGCNVYYLDSDSISGVTRYFWKKIDNFDDISAEAFSGEDS